MARDTGFQRHEEVTVAAHTFTERVAIVREVLTRETGRGTAAWFGREVAKVAGWLPSEVMLHRWWHGEAKPKPEAFQALSRLEMEARGVLRQRCAERERLDAEATEALTARLEAIAQRERDTLAALSERLNGKDGEG